MLYEIDKIRPLRYPAGHKKNGPPLKGTGQSVYDVTPQKGAVGEVPAQGLGQGRNPVIKDLQILRLAVFFLLLSFIIISCSFRCDNLLW